jgi:hypothetical protein
MPIFGGWRNYIVIEPCSQDAWYIGWQTKDWGGETSVSRIPAIGRVRILIGRGISLFGINEQGEQISVYVVAWGMIGAGGPYASKPLR